MYLDEIKDTYGLAEVASLCGVSESTIQRWIKTPGKFVQPRTVGGMLRFDCGAAVRAWLSAAGDVQTALAEPVSALDKISSDPAESVRGRRWASAWLAELVEHDPAAMRSVTRLSR